MLIAAASPNWEYNCWERMGEDGLVQSSIWDFSHQFIGMVLVGESGSVSLGAYLGGERSGCLMPGAPALSALPMHEVAGGRAPHAITNFRMGDAWEMKRPWALKPGLNR